MHIRLFGSIAANDGGAARKEDSEMGNDAEDKVDEGREGTSSPNDDLPLAGFRVLELGQVILGPYAGFLLAKSGADVVKIEPPRGEPGRGESFGALSQRIPFQILNANKRSVALDLKTEAGRRTLLDLAANADILLENFSAGTMDRLGLTWDMLRAANPGLVYASGTGFGTTGPDSDRLAMDVTIQAASGIMSVTGSADGPPTKAGPALVDVLGGTALYAAIVTALLRRSRTGVGSRVEISMQETVLAALVNSMPIVLMDPARQPPRTGNRHSGLGIAPYNVYPALDGHIAIIIFNEGHWLGLTNIMQRPDLAVNECFSTNRARVERMDETDAIVGEWTSRHTKADIVAQARGERIPCAAVQSIGDVLADPHLHARGAITWHDVPGMPRLPMLQSPLRFHDLGPPAIRAAPRLDEHGNEIAKEWSRRNAPA